MVRLENFINYLFIYFFHILLKLLKYVFIAKRAKTHKLTDNFSGRVIICRIWRLCVHPWCELNLFSVTWTTTSITSGIIPATTSSRTTFTLKRTRDKTSSAELFLFCFKIPENFSGRKFTARRWMGPTSVNLETILTFLGFENREKASRVSELGSVQFGFGN